tara:strand:+ start:644 stop:871 length:228 start_codon:yes stop_codon:yes gene_type:complete
MIEDGEIIEIVKLKIRDPITQREIAVWIIENMQNIEFPSSNTLERLIEVIERIRKEFPLDWKSRCFDSFVSFNKY